MTEKDEGQKHRTITTSKLCMASKLQLKQMQNFVVSEVKLGDMVKNIKINFSMLTHFDI